MRISRSTTTRARSWAPRSVRGRNTMPTPSLPGPSTEPARRIWSWKKSCGICTWMPAPSPVLPSASTAPRCQTAFSAAIAAATTCRRGSPSSAAMSPTPQASCSSAGIVEARGGEMRGVAAVVGDVVLGHGGRPIFLRHSRESGNPGPQGSLVALDSRFRGNDGSRVARINNSAPSCPGGPARGPSSSSPGPAACA